MGDALLFLKSGLGRAAIVGILFAITMASCGVQTSRLKHAKADLEEAKAAQIDPDTKVKWKAEYQLAQTNLATCHSDRDAWKTASDRQTQALEAAKALGDQRAAAIAKARQEAEKSASAAQSAGEALAAFKQKGGDVCARLLDVDNQVKEISR